MKLPCAVQPQQNPLGSDICKLSDQRIRFLLTRAGLSLFCNTDKFSVTWSSCQGKVEETLGAGLTFDKANHAIHAKDKLLKLLYWVLREHMYLHFKRNICPGFWILSPKSAGDAYNPSVEIFLLSHTRSVWQNLWFQIQSMRGEDDSYILAKARLRTHTGRDSLVGEVPRKCCFSQCPLLWWQTTELILT